MSIHSCGYHCDRPECIKAQRDELRDKFVAREWQGLTFDEQEMLRLCPHFGPSPARNEWIAGYKAAHGIKERNT